MRGGVHIPKVLIDEVDLYTLIRAAGVLAEGVTLDWSDEESARDTYLSVHAGLVRVGLLRLKDQLAQQDPTVGNDGIWVKLGLA